ncbi:uncharacterized protein LOC131256857 isoform X2 [Magnolia sinica]|uniref:uncharacterized protein LOC131256857 isoform X2 n=1 Tax=Magnolia sinica TaxID=86752 RepID=UPI0026591AE5|nr:uncharacterized protein LOC131256857 isoform X2 [Magnolia sinica]
MQFYRPIFLHKRAVMEPASEIQDKILFMINNISASNMDVKAKEFTDVLKEQYYPWFAQYMVMKRWTPQYSAKERKNRQSFVELYPHSNRKDHLLCS